MSAVLHIKSDEKLFNEVRVIADRVRDLASIVQNDMTITYKDYLDFRDRASVCITGLSNWTADVSNHVLGPVTKRELNADA